MEMIAYPMNTPDIIGAQNEMEGYDVQPNQKKAMAKMGAAMMASPRRSSGGTLSGLYCSMSRSYCGLKKRRYYCKTRSVTGVLRGLYFTHHGDASYTSAEDREENQTTCTGRKPMPLIKNNGERFE